MSKVKQTAGIKVSILFQSSDIADIKKAAQENNLTVSDIVRQGVRNYLDHMYEENFAGYFEQKITPVLRDIVAEEINKQANRLAGHITTNIKHTVVAEELIKKLTAANLTYTYLQDKWGAKNNKEVRVPALEEFKKILTSAHGEISRALSEGKKKKKEERDE